MMYLSGKAVDDPRIGVMLSFNVGKQRLHGHDHFAADNGCYARPDKYTDAGFLRWLDRLDRRGCLFATAPDVVGDAAATRVRARPMLPKIRELGFKAAYVGQDGARPNDSPWSEIDALFIGGTTDWKLSQAAGDLIGEAKQRGKHVHMGRVNSFLRLRVAHVLGCHSADGNYLSFEPARQQNVVDWLDRLSRQGTFEYKFAC